MNRLKEPSSESGWATLPARFDGQRAIECHRRRRTRATAAAVPPGNATFGLYELPPGYWIPANPKVTESIAFGQNQPLVDREYRARKGTVWNFRFTRGLEGLPDDGYVVGSNRSGYFVAAADNDEGIDRPCLRKGGKVSLRVQEDTPMAPPTTGFLTLDLEWDPNFRPDEVEEIVRLDGNDRRSRLTDADANSATLQGPDSIQPVKENGSLMIRVALPGRSAHDVSAIAGQVVDVDGRPIPGASVVVAGSGGLVPSNHLWHQATTDVEGRYRLREIPRTMIDGKPLKAALIVSKEGYVGIQSPLLTLSGDSSQKRTRSVKPIRLINGVPLRGVVVDHRGQPAAGASVRATFSIRLGQAVELFSR